MSATLAWSRQIANEAVRVDLEDLPLAAEWTDYPSVLYDQLSRFSLRLQELRLHFFKTCLIFD